MNLQDLLNESGEAPVHGTPLENLLGMTASVRGSTVYEYRETEINPETGLALEIQVIAAASLILLVQAVETYLSSIGERPYRFAENHSA